MKYVAVVMMLCAACNERKPQPAPAAEGSGSQARPDVLEVVAIDASMRRLVDDMVMIEGGRFVGQGIHCPDPGQPAIESVVNSHVEQEQSLPAFKIDRRPVTCLEYEDCVDARACRASEPAECREDVAVQDHDDAQRYCTWRRARLPTYAEWQRAVRGVRGDIYPTGKELDPAKICETPTSTANLRRCLHRSADGVLYAVENNNLGEWTSSLGCIVIKGRLTAGPAAPALLGKRLDYYVVDQQAAEFRCATN